MADLYTFETPDLQINQEITSFISNFYRVSDTPGDHDNYINQFADNATFVLGSAKSTGRTEIRTLRESMWEHVKARRHTVYKVFPYGNHSNEIMLFGKVEYELKSGGSAEKDWAGRAELQKDEKDGQWRFQFYQVYLDTAPPKK